MLDLGPTRYFFLFFFFPFLFLSFFRSFSFPSAPLLLLHSPLSLLIP